jgi:hypothetical protein
MAGVVVLRVRDFVEQLNARRHAIHLRFGVKLRHRQVAGLGGALGADPNQLPNRGQRAAKDGDRQDHLEQR